MQGRVADAVVLSVEERLFLEGQVRRHSAPRSLSDRCRMILLCADGLQSKEVAQRLGVHENTVGKWRRRFVKDRIEGLTDEYRPGRPRTVSDEQVAKVIERTLNTTAKDATHWSIRPPRQGFRILLSAGSGQPSACSRIAPRHSSSPPTRCSLTRFRISLASTCHRRTGRSCCVWMKNPRSRRSIANNRSCRWRRASLSGAPTPMFATARPRCSRRSTSPQGR